MLPFPRKSAQATEATDGEELALDENDLVVVETPVPDAALNWRGRPSSSPMRSSAGALPPTTPPVRVAPARPSGLGEQRSGLERARSIFRERIPRRTVDESIAEVVAGECLASIAETQERSRVRPSITREAPPPVPVVEPQEPPTTPLRVADLPSQTPAMRPEGRPPAAFVRSASRSATASSTVAPVSLSNAPEAPFGGVVMRTRPSVAWVIGAGVLGAVCALLAVRFVASGREPAVIGASTRVVTTPPEPVAAPEPVVNPVSSVTAGGPAVVVHFGDDQGVAIFASPAPSPSPQSPPRPAPAPQRPRSASSGGAASTASGTPATPESAARRRALLTTEQQLADAQLKASMR